MIAFTPGVGVTVSESKRDSILHEVKRRMRLERAAQHDAATTVQAWARGALVRRDLARLHHCVRRSRPHTHTHNPTPTQTHLHDNAYVLFVQHEANAIPCCLACVSRLPLILCGGVVVYVVVYVRCCVRCCWVCCCACCSVVGDCDSDIPAPDPAS